MKNKITKKEKGFTIIEVLVTVVIIGLLVTSGVIKREKSINIKRAQIRTQQVKDMIELTKDYALTGETVGGAVPQYFVFSITGGNTYKIGSLNPNNNVINSKTVTIPATENVLLDNTTIQFTAPHADMTCTDCEIRVCGDNTCTDADTVFTIKVTDYSIEIIN